MSLKASIKRIAGEQVVVMIRGTVTEVDKNSDTMSLSPLDGSADYEGVFLEPIDKTMDIESDIVRYPQVGCIAIIGMVNNDDQDTFLIKASKYESVLMTIAKSVKITATGNGNVTIDANSIKINGGLNKGLIKILPLIAKINRVESILNQLLSAFKTHVHSGVTTGPGVSGPTPTPSPALITPLTKQTDLENTNVTH
jgi:hypothetical protein